MNEQNFVEQKDNTAVSYSKGDAVAAQSGTQSNTNAQVAVSEAENEREQHRS